MSGRRALICLAGKRSRASGSHCGLNEKEHTRQGLVRRAVWHRQNESLVSREYLLLVNLFVDMMR